ncbi:MAG TPA: hypothetical protein DEQ61_13870 [Streptomyces sp.]|nr:hypothetical protein [Streptomyces sp.]
MRAYVSTASPWVTGAVLSAARIAVGFLFGCHGAASLFGVLGGAHGTDGGTVAFGLWPGWWAAVIQLTAGGLVTLGLFTRPAALLCSGSMAYAYATVHLPDGPFPLLNGGEPAAVYAWAFAAIAAAGPGDWALDRLLGRTGSVAGEADGHASAGTPVAR